MFVIADRRVTFSITGMTCANCTLTVERNLKKVEGVTEASVNFAAEQGSVSLKAEGAGVGDSLEMAISSITVVSNSLRLYHARIR